MSAYQKPVIGLDVDGVILDYVSGLMEFASSKGIRLGCKPNQVDTWAMTSAFPDLDDATIWSMIENFSEDEAFGNLRPYPGAIETISSLTKKFPENPLVAITSAGKSNITKELRTKSLKGIPFQAVHILPLGESKEQHLAQLPVGSLYVDDLMKNVTTAEKAGVAGILVRRSYNVTDHHTRVAHNWREIETLVHDIIAPSFNLIQTRSPDATHDLIP